MGHSNVEVAKRWRMEQFECKQTQAPENRGDPLSSDVALRLPAINKKCGKPGSIAQTSILCCFRQSLRKPVNTLYPRAARQV